VRKRGRGRTLSLKEESNKRAQKRRDSLTATSQLSDAIIAQTQARRSKLEVAIKLLLNEYIERLSDEHMQMAIDLMETPNKATIFTSFGGIVGEPFEIRDCWLERHAGVEVFRADD